MSMSMSKTMQRWLSASAIVLAASTSLPGTASAQLLFDWGGDQKKVNDTGRQQVRINLDAKPGEIIVSFSDRRLFLVTGPGIALSYPVAIPREQDRWEGVTSVSQKRENPSWTPTPTMIKENPKLPRWVPGGHPMNPLGNRALYLGSSLYRIHGTDAPWTIGTAVSKGCIRMYNKDALDVFERTKVGAKVLVTWKSYQFQPTPDQPQAIATQAQPDAAARYHSPAGRGVERIDRGERDQQQALAPKRWRQPGEDVDLGVPPTERAAAPREAAPGSDPQPRARDNRETRREARDGRDQRSAGRDRNGDTPAVNTPAVKEQAAPAVQAAPVANEVPSAPKARSDASQKAAAIETGSVSERRARAKAATPVAAEQNADTPKPAPQAQAAPQPDIATRALEAAERAAAAAERAAAAAERAERAVSARAAAPATVVAPDAPAAPLASD